MSKKGNGTNCTGCGCTHDGGCLNCSCTCSGNICPCCGSLGSDSNAETSDLGEATT